jgi:hypothetical protein
VGRGDTAGGGVVSDPLQEARRLAPRLAAFVENNGYEVVTLSDGERSAVPMSTAEALTELRALAQRVEDAEARLHDVQNQLGVESMRCERAEGENERLRAVVDAAYIAKHEGRFEPLHDALQALRQEGER